MEGGDGGTDDNNTSIGEVGDRTEDHVLESDEDPTKGEQHKTLLDHLMGSAGDESLFISWEPGKINQFYFLTTKEFGQQVEAWLEETMNYFVLKYGIAICQDRFAKGVPEMPSGESKARPNKFVLNYIHTLGIEEDPIVGHGYRDRAPPSMRPAKKRTLVVFGGDKKKSSWNTSLFETTTPGNGSLVPNYPSGTEGKSAASTGTHGEQDDSITRLTDNLSFTKNDFQEAINEENAKREVADNVMMDRLTTM